MVPDLHKRVVRLYPNAVPKEDFYLSEGVIGYWSEKLGPRPTEAELMAVDLTRPTADEADLTLAVQILKTDIPASWKTSTNAQQRIAWATRRVLIEIRSELREG